MILAAGCCKSTTTCQTTLQQRGFSLLEMLIVILVVGLLYSMAGSMLTLSVADPFQEQADRLRERVTLAQQESVIRHQALAMGFDSKGYAFFAQDDNEQWQLMDNDDLFKRYELNPDLEQVLYLQGQAVKLPAPADIHPQVFILPTGEMLGFEWHLRQGLQRETILKYDNMGRLVDANS